MYLNPFKVKDLVKFSETIEPKTIVEDGDRKIMLFGLEKNQELKPHFSPVDVAVFVLEGKITLTVEGQTFDIKEGEMFLIPEDKAHSVLAEKKSEFMVIRI